MRVALFADAGTPDEYPADGLPEVAVLGRSNVGKSSFINALVGRKRLARTSAAPGKTRRIHFYRVEDALYVVDLPGYGYARVSRRERASWRPMVEAYLRGGREPLRGALQLVDCRRGLREAEHELLDWLVEQGIPVVIVLTKCDKLKRSELARALAGVRGEVEGRALEVAAVSVTRPMGLPQVARKIDEWTRFTLRQPDGKPLAADPGASRR